jgi:eukaryotic-like serine/threonine-protein kinase
VTDPADDRSPELMGVPREVYADASFCKKYELERELGVGGAGVVVCARHRELDERVAIKFLLTGPENQDAIARFRREARAANRVRDEHVVRIIDVATIDAGIPYVVMEYLDGVDLERMLQQTPDRQLPVRDAIEFVLQACEALAECHQIGIVHRDLKPSNLFCTHGADGLPIIKLLDFGISKLGPATIDGAMTGKNSIMGSPRYMSPEQFSAPAEVDHRTDIWALGIILYELVTGAVPFVGSTLISIWERVKKDEPPPIQALRRDAPLSLGPIVLRCLEKDPAARFQNVAELAKALLPLAPERSRGSVARIVRIVESPGVTTASLSLPPSGHIPAETATSVSIQSLPHPSAPRRSGVIAFAIAATVGVTVLGIREIQRQGQDEVSKTVDTATAVPAQTPPPTPQPPVVAPLPGAVQDQPSDAAELATSAPDASAARRVVGKGAPASSPGALSESKRPVSQPSTPAVRPANALSTATPATPSASAPPVGSARAGDVTAAREPSRTPAQSHSARAPSVSPWVVDIVEKRKPKPGEKP